MNSDNRVQILKKIATWDAWLRCKSREKPDFNARRGLSDVPSAYIQNDRWILRVTDYKYKSNDGYKPCTDMPHISTNCINITADMTHRWDPTERNEDLKHHLLWPLRKQFMPQDNALWTEGKRYRRFCIDVITEDGNNPCNFQPLKRSKKADGSDVPLRHVNPRKRSDRSI
jgi:hypothetical protein